MTHDLRNPTSIAGKDFPSLTHAAMEPRIAIDPSQTEKTA